MNLVCMLGWGKKLLKADIKKGGKCIFFPLLVKRMHIFSPIDLKNTKLQQKKGCKYFACGAQLLIIVNFSWEKI